jgi:hypothetical protein
MKKTAKGKVPSNIPSSYQLQRVASKRAYISFPGLLTILKPENGGIPKLPVSTPDVPDFPVSRRIESVTVAHLESLDVFKPDYYRRNALTSQVPVLKATSPKYSYILKNIKETIAEHAKHRRCKSRLVWYKQCTRRLHTNKSSRRATPQETVRSGP